MKLQDLIDTFEELKKNVYIINRGDKGIIIIKFKNENFFHLIGLHKINFNTFVPDYIKTKDKIYKHIKKNVERYNNILMNQIAEKNTLELRINTFPHILDLLNGNNTTLYNLSSKTPGSLYDGDYGLLKLYENFNCLFGLKKVEETNNQILCVPQSWMASKRVNQLIEFKKPIFMESIYVIPISMYNDNFNTVSAH